MAKFTGQDLNIHIVDDDASSSVEFAVDSKGNVKPKVKVYSKSADEALAVAGRIMREAIEKARTLETNGTTI